MELKIDTTKDSVEDIKKVIKFLQDHVNENIVTNYDSTDYSIPGYDDTSTSTESSGGMFNMFGDDSSSDSTESYDSSYETEEPEEEVKVMAYDDF